VVDGASGREQIFYLNEPIEAFKKAGDFDMVLCSLNSITEMLSD